MVLNITLEYNRGILFVRLNGKLNRTTAYKINNYLVPVILKQKIKYLVYNLFNLEDIDEDGQEALLNTESAIKNNKGIICLCEVSNYLNKKINHVHIKKIKDELCAFEEIEV